MYRGASSVLSTVYIDWNRNVLFRERETGSALCKARLYQFPVHKGGFFAVGAKPNPWSLALWCACIDVPDIRRVGVSEKRTKDVCPALLLKTVYF